MAGDDLSAVGRFLYEAGTLKHARRTGWWMAGVRDPESVAEHSWRTALIATIIAKLEGADADKLECMLQGIEYKAQGYENAQRWIDNSRGRLTTETANRLADELLAQGSIDWLRSALGEERG
ncbi:HD domain-containing protein [Streptomyces bacillaris]|uniref:HD domain-containing protein n=1 Tax=Streptomyces bacillaris TaxID=68179 RepID=UPI003465ADC5